MERKGDDGKSSVNMKGLYFWFEYSINKSMKEFGPFADSRKRTMSVGCSAGIQPQRGKLEDVAPKTARYIEHGVERKTETADRESRVEVYSTSPWWAGGIFSREL